MYIYHKFGNRHSELIDKAPVLFAITRTMTPRLCAFTKASAIGIENKTEVWGCLTKSFAGHINDKLTMR
uniref:Uncharacterized protein n=1 Tax=Glossina pallidipes TaxID=7398 RepID=A0A1A9Z4P1_GLOPL